MNPEATDYNPLLDEDENEDTHGAVAVERASSGKLSAETSGGSPHLEEEDFDGEDPHPYPAWRPSRPITVPPARPRPALSDGETDLHRAGGGVQPPEPVQKLIEKKLEEAYPSTALRPKKPAKVYGRKLLNKSDDRLLYFLAKVGYCNTRQLSVVMGKTERQVQRKLKGLQELGLTDNLIMANTKALWVCTAKGARTLQARGVPVATDRLKGSRIADINRSKIAHHLAVSTVAAQLVSGMDPLGLGPVEVAQELLHVEGHVQSYWLESRKAYLKAMGKHAPSMRTPTAYMDMVAAVRDCPHQLNGNGVPRITTHPLSSLYLFWHDKKSGAAGGHGEVYSKLPDLAVGGPRRDGVWAELVAVEVELHPKSLREYDKVVATYLGDTTYRQVVYVTNSRVVRDRLTSAITQWEQANGSERARAMFRIVPLRGMDGQVYTDDPYLL